MQGGPHHPSAHCKRLLIQQAVLATGMFERKGTGKLVYMMRKWGLNLSCLQEPPGTCHHGMRQNR